MPEERPVTQADLSALEARIVERLLERIEKSETNLLNAFRSWAIRSETRTKANSLLVNSFDERLAIVDEGLITLEQRVSQLERGK